MHNRHMHNMYIYAFIYFAANKRNKVFTSKPYVCAASIV